MDAPCIASGSDEFRRKVGLAVIYPAFGAVGDRCSGYVMATEGDKADDGMGDRLSVEIQREEYSVPWQGVTYDATYSGRRYPCVVAIHHLQMKIGKAALAEFSARLPDVARATENILRAVQPEADEETRKSTDRIIVPLGS